MKQNYTLEISVETLEAAKAAERGGADRVELCENLSVGGLTPSTEIMRAVRAQLRIPIFVMIRLRAGDFVYSGAELAQMERSIAGAKKSGMDGVVLGVLTKDRRVDIERTRELVVLATPLPVTYHRAFDEARDLRQALEDVIKTGASRILTSGGAKTAAEGAVVLSELVSAAENRIIIVPGAGNNAANISLVVQKTRACEFHSGLSSALPYGSREYKRFEEEVRKLAEQLAQLSANESPSG
jgi:copper homeostasis protein